MHSTGAWTAKNRPSPSKVPYFRQSKKPMFVPRLPFRACVRCGTHHVRFSDPPRQRDIQPSRVHPPANHARGASVVVVLMVCLHVRLRGSSPQDCAGMWGSRGSSSRCDATRHPGVPNCLDRLWTSKRTHHTSLRCRLQKTNASSTTYAWGRRRATIAALHCTAAWRWLMLCMRVVTQISRQKEETQKLYKQIEALQTRLLSVERELGSA